MILPPVFIDIHQHHKQSTAKTGELSIYNWIPEDWSQSPPSVPYTLGIHPWFVDDRWQEKLLRLEHLLQSDRSLLAIGETGLDSLCKTPMELQEVVFKTHILLAEKYQRPLIIHCVKAHERLLTILKTERPSVPVIIHGFNQKSTIAENLLNAGLFLSFGKCLENEGSNASKQITKMGINGAFFIETDESEIGISQIYEFAAQRLDCEVEPLKIILQERFINLFNTNKYKYKL